jgi:hypothetical protein
MHSLVHHKSYPSYHFYAQVVVFWVVTLCGIIGRYQNFGKACTLHAHGQNEWDEDAVRLLKQVTRRAASWEGVGTSLGQ